jgi:hypothetical protein
MAQTRSIVVLAAAPLLLAALSGCGTVQNAAQTADQAATCTKAISTVSFNPNLNDPSAAVDESHKKADELRKLADESKNADVRKSLRDAADSLGNVKVSDLAPARAADWVQQKTKLVQGVTSACANIGKN